MTKDNQKLKGDVLIGQRVKKYRETRSFTQKKLADLVMVSSSSITRLELGQTMVSVFTIQKIAEALQVPVSSILTDTDEWKLEYADLTGIYNKLKKCTPKQRMALIQSFEHLLDIFFLE